ncbi:MAG: hypothetical protein IJ994_09060 [Firmicutes bacterium]|nr:hypothetical protein [Bacillota bacterium]
MMGEAKRSCVDVGSEYCPCSLALTGDCLICSRLQGEVDEDTSTCDCGWEGSCPYTILTQNGGKPAGRREERSAVLLERKDYGQEISVLIFDVGSGFAQKASIPGSFVFLRRNAVEDGAWDHAGSYDMPVSVMKADETAGTIHLAIRREGPKSKMLLNRISIMDDYAIRGPYYSGLLGAERLRSANIQGKRILFLTKGIGAAPAILAMDRLLTMNVPMRWLADETKIDGRLLEEYGEAVKLEPMILDDQLYDIVVISGSPFFVESMGREMRKRLPEAELVISNNATMCCGEGICGACTEVTEDGQVIRRCKCGNQ